MDLFRRSSYSFDLPDTLIAAFPLEERASARLLVVRKKSRALLHQKISDLPTLLPKGSVMVANNTQVFRARLKGGRIGSPGKLEFFLLKDLGDSVWQGLIRSSASVNPGFRFWVGNGAHQRLEAYVLTRDETDSGTIFTAKFSKDPVVQGLGEVPLPPYILSKRDEQNSIPDPVLELKNYNTVFAKHLGSVAAPTAGRHFTTELISDLMAKGFSWEEITLHVGLGTFKPVMVDDVRDHTLHPELSFISPEVSKKILEAKKKNRPIIAIGTTSTRTLEGRVRGTTPAFLLPPGEEEINLFIHPGVPHAFKLVDGILTNFHLPESTLFMMVASFLEDLPFLHQIYAEAIREAYRFYSYGDAMLILPD